MLTVPFKFFADAYVIGIGKQFPVLVVSSKNSVVDLEVPNHTDDSEFLRILLG